MINCILSRMRPYIACPRIIQSGIDVFVWEEYMQVIIDSWKHCHKTKGLQIYGWCIMPGHVHMIIGSSKNMLEDIVRDTKSFTSTTLNTAIKEHPQERRKEWMLWLKEGQERKMATTKIGSSGNHIISLLKSRARKCLMKN